jgi:hypothetical protein
MPQPGFWYMDQLAGKQEKEYNRINEELKNNPTFEVPAEMRKASYRTIKKEFSKAHRATAKRVAWKVFQRVSILIAIVTLLITGALAISPELRVYALNLALETFDDHTSIRFLSPKTTDVDAILKAEWLPTGYICANSSDDDKMWTFLHREMCGIEITGFVEQKTHGRVRLSPGTLYTLLGKFQDEGLIEETQTDGRKRSYRITDKGKTAFQDELVRLKACVLDGEEESLCAK